VDSAVNVLYLHGLHGEDFPSAGGAHPLSLSLYCGIIPLNTQRDSYCVRRCESFGGRGGGGRGRSLSRRFRRVLLPPPAPLSVSRAIVEQTLPVARVANKPGYGGRDLYRRCRESKSERERERESAVARRKLHAHAFTTRRRLRMLTYIRSRCEKVLHYLFFGSLEPPLMIIGAM